MAKRFFVRVQLHDVAEGDDAYVTLHEEMEKRHFGRTIVVDGVEYKLPWGTYIGPSGQTGATREGAATLVEQAVKATVKLASFVIVETDTGMRVGNLEPVEQPKSAEEELMSALEAIGKKKRPVISRNSCPSCRTCVR